LAEIINLRQARKKRQRAERETRADANRAKFGRTKAERDRQRSVADRDARQLEGHLLPSAGNIADSLGDGPDNAEEGSSR